MTDLRGWAVDLIAQARPWSDGSKDYRTRTSQSSLEDYSIDRWLSTIETFEFLSTSHLQASSKLSRRIVQPPTMISRVVNSYNPIANGSRWLKRSGGVNRSSSPLTFVDFLRAVFIPGRGWLAVASLEARAVSSIR